MIDIKEYGYTETTPCPQGLIPGRITQVHRDRFMAVCRHGEVDAGLGGSYVHTAQGQDFMPAVGDFVFLRYNDIGKSQIVNVLERKSKFSRTDFSGHAVGYVKTILEQVVATNFDYVLITTSLNQDFNANRVLRYLAAARQSGGQPVVVLTKADLCPDYSGHVAQIRSLEPNVPIHAVSAHTGQGMEELAQYLAPGNTLVFLGMSGVGKSSLLNAAAGREVMKVKEIREKDGRGRHTTTHRQLVMLPSGAMIIDTPGMRALGLWKAEEGIEAVFGDIEELMGQCRFSDCGHKSEPGCAVLAAIEDGSLDLRRWESYQAQRREARFVEKKAKQLTLRDERVSRKTGRSGKGRAKPGLYDTEG